MSARLLEDQIVLLADDNGIEAIDLEQELRDAGAQVVWCSTLEASLAAIETDAPRAAVICLMIGGKSAGPLAEALRAARIATIAYSGLTPAEWPVGIPVIEKPAPAFEIVKELARVADYCDR